MQGAKLIVSNDNLWQSWWNSVTVYNGPEGVRLTQIFKVQVTDGEY
jgi:hypothetical protein